MHVRDCTVKIRVSVCRANRVQIEYLINVAGISPKYFLIHGKASNCFKVFEQRDCRMARPLISKNAESFELSLVRNI